jgi:adenylosuccinate lyase
MRERGTQANDLPRRLAADGRLGLSAEEIEALLGDPIRFTGNAQSQTAQFVAQVEGVVARHPHAAAYVPEPIL